MKHYSRIVLITFLVCSATVACQRRPVASGPAVPASDAAAIRLNNLGVAEMNRGRTGEALKLFQQAWRDDPGLLAARLNEGIALLNTQRFEEAREVLLDVTRRQPGDARAWYNAGILYRNLAEVQPAIDAFERVHRLDPGDADALYFLGQLHAQASRYKEAIVWYERCLDLDPLHLSAVFGLARANQLAGNEEDARRHLARFDELTKSGLGKPISLAYGEQGPYSTAEPVAGAALAPEAFSVRFAQITEQAGLRLEAGGALEKPLPVFDFLSPGACFIDFDADGRPDILLPGASRRLLLYRNNGGGKFSDVTARAGLNIAAGTVGCTAGDYDNDGWDDFAVGLQDRVAVYRNSGDGTFRDVTSALGIAVSGSPLGLVFADYDHDGDVDFYVSRFSNSALAPGGEFKVLLDQAAPGNQLWRNNGNGSFVDQTAQSGLAGDIPGVGALPLDFNNDRAVDLVLTGPRPAAALLMNSREGPFRPADAWKSPFPAAAAGAVAWDFNKDGWMDLAFTHWSQPGLSVWKNLEGDGFERVRVPDSSWSRGWGIAAVDVDNDGWLDLAAAGEGGSVGRVLVLRNLGGDRFADVTTVAGLDSLALNRPRALISGDVDGDGDSDLLITQSGGTPVLLRNDGGSRRGSVRLAFQGLNDNRNGIGAKVEVFAGSLRQKWEVGSASGYLGQSAPGILAGIGDNREADIVRLLWPTGVPQDEVQLAAGERHVVREIDRRGSSCPVVFVWNGDRYDFVSDMIGAGIIGEWIGPDQRNTPDPTEYLKIDGSRVKRRNGRLSFRFAEVMEELTYLDEVRLLAIDHPSNVEVYPNEYFAAVPPFPEFRVVTTQNARPVSAAVDGRGRNVLSELLRRDRRYVTGFGSLQYPGFAEMHYLELDLGDTGDADSLRLIMHGFIDYFTITSIFAAYQGDVHAVVPFLEVPDGSGGWTRILDDIGFPAGLARTMVADLSGRIPPGISRIRIGTNLKIYWDQILIDTSEQATPVEVRQVPLAEAALAFRGFPRKLEGSVRGDVSYIHEDVSPTGPFAYPSGYYTDYGNVLPLLRESDDRFVIIGPGDETSLEFDPSGLPSLKPGWSRDYFLYADGFAKDMDFYSAYSSTVEPLPFHAMGQYPYGPQISYPTDASRQAYRLGVNTRYRGPREGVTSYRYRY